VLANELPKSHIINVFDPVEEVIKQIQKCDYILSSSMHGLIVADSFLIPNSRLLLSKGIISDFKFDDYYSAFGIKQPDPLTPENIIDKKVLIKIDEGDYQRKKINQIKESILKSFPLNI